MMITEIEIISGKILHLIDEKKRPISIRELETHLESEKESTNKSINWLVQEGHVHLIKNGNDKYLCNC